MLFSIVVPAYNYARYLPRAVESVLGQGGGDFEIVIVDDGSTDATPVVGQRFAQDHPGTVRYLRQENSGPAVARNRGIRESTGRFLIFLDADDRLLPGALQHFRAFCKGAETLGMVFGGHRSTYVDGRCKDHAPRPLSADRLANFTGYLRKDFGISNGATAVSRKVFDRVVYPEQLRNSEDISVFAQTLALFDCRSFAETVLEVFKHEDSLRNNIDLIVDTGDALVDVVFDPEVLPPEFMGLKAEYQARHALSLFRSLYLAGRGSSARSYFYRAAKDCPRLVLEGSYLTKFLRSFFRQAKRQRAL